MKFNSKNISYCVIFLSLFFSLSVLVEAEQFTIDTKTYLKSDLGGERANSDINPIYVDNGNHTASSYAYCTDHGNWFYGLATGSSASKTNNTYTLDKSFMEKKNCYYKDGNGNEYYNGKCSEIAGYVLAWANLQFGISESQRPDIAATGVGLFADDIANSFESDSGRRVTISDPFVRKYYWQQSSLWAYFDLANRKSVQTGRGEIGLNNTDAAGWYEQNTMIKEVVDRALTQYAIHSVNGTSTLNSLVIEKKNLNFKITDIYNNAKDKINTNFYYNSTGTGSCQTSGFYRTVDIVIANLGDDGLVVELSTDQTSNVQICIKGESTCDATVERDLAHGEELTFFLKSNYDLSGEVNLNVVGSYQNVKIETDKIQYDTTRYTTTVSTEAIDKYGNPQGVLTLQEYIKEPVSEEDKDGTNTDDIVDDKITYRSSENLQFKRQKIIRRSCSNTTGDDSVSLNGSNLSNSENTRNKSIRCESSPPNSSNSSSTSLDDKYYVAEFFDCTCYTLTFDEGKKVNLIIYESAMFQYGKLISDGKLYAGGGFYFDIKKVPTYYEAEVGWVYAEYIGSTPYYYNETDKSDYDASQYENMIDSELQAVLKNELKLNFKTRNSNDYKNNSDEEIILTMPLKIENISKDSESTGDNNTEKFIRIYNIKSDDYLQMPKAYFSESGEVWYSSNGEANDDYPIFGGNNYYVPMYYNETTFPFDISTSNVSVLEGITFNVDAVCPTPVEAGNNFANLYYRSIDVNNPFPNADISDNYQTGVPSNWREWYYTGENANINFQRINQTYINYPDSVPLYSITLNSEKLNKIGGIQDYYTDWSKMESDGTSTFVDDFFEIKAAGGVSYCGLGQFKTDCDN